MRALQYMRFGGPISLVDLPEPVAGPTDAVVQVTASGLCRSDWHGWQGHDSDVRPPQVPGHELAGTIVALGRQVCGWKVGQRVTVPFVCACGTCGECARGRQQVCARQRQPGFTDPGSFAERVLIPAAQVNLVGLPEQVPDAAAALLGCRYGTAWHGLFARANLRAGQTLAVFGMGGVGLACLQIGRAAGARVVAVDRSAAALDLAVALGASGRVHAAGSAADVAAAVREVAGADVDVGVDAAGSVPAASASVLALRRGGRHVQIGLLPPAAGPAALPMHRAIAYELTLLGSHGIAAHEYPPLLAAVADGELDPLRLITREVDLAAAAVELAGMGSRAGAGVTIVRPAAE